ncbi:MAG: DUF721 domain-containing protein [Phycisphaeraceae bacterium]|nr:DUF721 domain-containing protein [Phycisphaeraceae bacterium]MCW5753802.1 DUF721 domain-containing protein [Phycisphaeraceae bacterium]
MTDRTRQILTQRRSIRPVPELQTPISDHLAELRSRLDAERKASGKAGDAWASVAPDDLKAMADVVGLVRGVLTLRCRDSAAHFEVDRWLRTEGRGLLLSAAHAPVRRIKLVNGPTPTPLDRPPGSL